jgi:hypothetical protein
MSLGLQARLIDDLEDTYRDWRRASAAVEAAYRRWQLAPATAAHRAYAEYVASLDDEEDAAEEYAQSFLRYLRGRTRERILSEWLDREA